MTADELFGAVEQRLEQEDWLGAIAAVHGHDALVASDARLSWDVGWAHYKISSLRRAEQHLGDAVALDPGWAVAHFGHGVILRELERTADAEQALRRSLALRDGHLPRLILSVMYLGLGRDAEAEAVQREGVERRPDDPRRVHALGNLLWDLGRTEEAEACYAAARALPPRPSKPARP
jgi:Flp pilus assembly protein TadD